MTPDQLERILSSEEPLVPSSGFKSSVMDGIRAAAIAPPPLRFPWLRFALGNLALLISSGILFPAVARRIDADLLVHAMVDAAAALQDPRVAIPILAIVGSSVMTAMTLRLTGARL